MKIAFLLFSLLLSPAQAAVPQMGQEIYVITNENHCNVKFTAQQRLAIRDVLAQAELECGTNLVPIQVSETKIIENHSRIHYRLGVIASATFRCEVLSPEEL